jgi:hypothetical protein
MNAFGELLIALINAQYGDIDAGGEAIQAATGLSEDELVGLIEGDLIVEDVSLLEAIISAFPDADAQDIEVIADVASQVEAVDAQGLQDDMEALEGDVVDVTALAGEGAPGTPAAQPSPVAAPAGAGAGAGGFSRRNSNAAQFDSRLANMEAAFSNLALSSELSDRLVNLNNQADHLVNQGVLPPAYKQLLIGNFSSSTQLVANFTATAHKNGVTLDEMLFAAEYALGLMSEAAPVVEFKDYSVSDEQVAMANFSASLDAAAAGDLDAIFNY